MPPKNRIGKNGTPKPVDPAVLEVAPRLSRQARRSHGPPVVVPLQPVLRGSDLFVHKIGTPVGVKIDHPTSIGFLPVPIPTYGGVKRLDVCAYLVALDDAEPGYSCKLVWHDKAHDVVSMLKTAGGPGAGFTDAQGLHQSQQKLVWSLPPQPLPEVVWSSALEIHPSEASRGKAPGPDGVEIEVATYRPVVLRAAWLEVYS